MGTYGNVIVGITMALYLGSSGFNQQNLAPLVCMILSRLPLTKVYCLEILVTVFYRTEILVLHICKLTNRSGLLVTLYTIWRPNII
jgi:hypothetical protein